MIQKIKNFFSSIKLYFFAGIFIICNLKAIILVHKNDDIDGMNRLMEKLSKKIFNYYKIKIEVEGAFPNDLGNALFVANHQSMIDSAIMYNIVPKPMSFFIAGEFEYMLEFPIIGTFLKLCNNVYIDRKNIKNGVRGLRKGVEILNSEVNNLVVFPEGMIKSEFENLEDEAGVFLGGPFRAATSNKKPIVIVAIDGSDKIHDGTKIGSKVHRGTIRVAIKCVLYYNDYKELRPQEIADLCHSIICNDLKN